MIPQLLPDQVTMLATPDDRGVALAEAVERLARRLGLAFESCPPMAQWELTRRVAGASEIVVVDLSSDHAPSPLFNCLTPLILLHPNVLVISRTPLPLNLVPQRSGGAPAYPGSLTDDEMLAWLEDALADAGQAELPPRLPPAFFNDVATADMAPLHQLYEHLAARPAVEGHRIFVSYRGVHHPEALALRQHLRQGDAETDVRVLTPGALSLDNELLSDGRRWQIAGLLEDELRPVAELHVLATDDYRDSWFTVCTEASWAKRCGGPCRPRCSKEWMSSGRSASGTSTTTGLTSATPSTAARSGTTSASTNDGRTRSNHRR